MTPFLFRHILCCPRKTTQARTRQLCKVGCVRMCRANPIKLSLHCPERSMAHLQKDTNSLLPICTLSEVHTCQGWTPEDLEIIDTEGVSVAMCEDMCTTPSQAFLVDPAHAFAIGIYTFPKAWHRLTKPQADKATFCLNSLRFSACLVDTFAQPNSTPLFDSHLLTSLLFPCQKLSLKTSVFWLFLPTDIQIYFVHACTGFGRTCRLSVLPIIFSGILRHAS